MKTTKKIFITAALLAAVSCQESFNVEDTGNFSGSQAAGLVEEDPAFLNSYIQGLYSYMVSYGNYNYDGHDNFGFLSCTMVTDFMCHDIVLAGTQNWGWFDYTYQYNGADYVRAYQQWANYFTLINNSNEIINFFEAVFEVIMKIVLTIIKVAPIGVFAIVAKMISMQAGDMTKLADIAQSLGLFVLIIWIGCAIHFFIIMPSIVYFLGHENPWRHMKKMSTAILTAFSTCSSGAALPFSMKDSQEKCGISNKIASFTLPLGATINMNGTALYEGVAVIFIAQVYGIDLSFLEQLIIVVTVLFSAIGAASIPMAGLVMLSVALSVAGLPMEGIGLVLAVEQLCDMPRTATNSYGDMCAAVVIAKSEGEKLTI